MLLIKIGKLKFIISLFLLQFKLRLIIKINPNFELKFRDFNNYWVQGFIYRLLLNSPFDRHDENKFKHFNFVILPKNDFKINKRKILIISSPNEDFIYYLNKKIQENNKLIFGSKYESNIEEIKIIDPKIKKREWITETPIILDIGKKVNKKHLYWTPYLKEKELRNFNYFLERLTENSLKKISAYFDIDYEKLQEKYPLIFEKYKFLDSKTVFFNKENITIRMAGTLWELTPIYNLKYKYLKYLFEVGLGEKNSLGFGFVNQKK